MMSGNQYDLFSTLTDKPLNLINYTYRKLGNQYYEVCDGSKRVIIESDSEEMETILTKGAKQLSY